MSQDFKLDYLFWDNYLVVSSLLYHHQVQIPVLTFINSDTSGYTFMDQNFVYQHFFPLYKLKHSV